MRILVSTIAGVVVAAQLSAAPLPLYDDAPLRAVRFVDRNEGWAVGDHGGIWHSIDGGKSWERQPSGTRASLRAVQFLTPYTGFAVGRLELPNRAGSQGVVLTTADGGATWREVTSALLPGLNAVQFFDENRGIVAGDGTDAFPSGVFATTDGGRTWKMLPGPRGRSWRHLEFTDPENGRLTCEAGTVTVTRGVVGSQVDGTPPPQSLRVPGCSIPLHDRFMLDDRTGWAVGDLGTILGTTDGKTWTVLRCGGQRAAVLFVHVRPESVPLGAIALLGKKDGYLAAVLCLGANEEPRLSAAVRECGGAAAEIDRTFAALGQTSELPATGTPAGSASRDEALLARLVLALRTWRPEVVICDQLSPDAPASEQQALLGLKEAFTRAADPNAFPDQMQQFGVSPHAARKLYALAPATAEGQVTLDLTGFVPELGDSARDHVESAAMLVGSDAPKSLKFRLIAHRLPGAEQHAALLEGIELAEGGTARRKTTEPFPAAAEREKAVKLRRQLEAMLDDPTSVGGLEPALAQVIGALGGMPDDLAARAAVSMGLRLARSGQWTAARELFAVVVEKYPAYAESVEAVRWLIRYQTSGEVRRRIELGHFPVFQKAAFTREDEGVQPASHAEPLTARPVYRFSSPEVLRQWNEAGLKLETQLAAFGASYTLDPANNCCLVAARRNLGLNLQATAQLKAFLGATSTESGWPARLADEIRLMNGELPRQTPLATCRLTGLRPFLDGKLEEECWKTAAAIPLNAGRAATQGYTTEARVSHDDKFLYVALRCAHPEGKQVTKAEKRQRDADLRGHDRVEVLLDLDRDYQTYYRLQIDHRGCVAEDCWGDRSWDPRWFVAVEPSPTGWTAELAIPLAELTGSPPSAGQVWGMNVTRVVPGVGIDSWGGPCETAPQPAAMGLMRFVRE